MLFILSPTAAVTSLEDDMCHKQLEASKNTDVFLESFVFL